MSMKKKKNSMFTKPSTKYLSETIEIDNPGSAEGAAKELLEKFRNLKQRKAKVDVKRSLVLAANRARAMTKRKDFSKKEKKEMKEVADIYEKYYKKMNLD